jgi:hypothetical protein
LRGDSSLHMVLVVQLAQSISLWSSTTVEPHVAVLPASASGALLPFELHATAAAATKNPKLDRKTIPPLFMWSAP